MLEIGNLKAATLFARDSADFASKLVAENSHDHQSDSRTRSETFEPFGLLAAAAAAREPFCSLARTGSCKVPI